MGDLSKNRHLSDRDRADVKAQTKAQIVLRQWSAILLGGRPTVPRERFTTGAFCARRSDRIEEQGLRDTAFCARRRRNIFMPVS